MLLPQRNVTRLAFVKSSSNPESRDSDFLMFFVLHNKYHVCEEQPGFPSFHIFTKVGRIYAALGQCPARPYAKVGVSIKYEGIKPGAAVFASLASSMEHLPDYSENMHTDFVIHGSQMC